MKSEAQEERVSSLAVASGLGLAVGLPRLCVEVILAGEIVQYVRVSRLVVGRRVVVDHASPLTIVFLLPPVASIKERV